MLVPEQQRANNPNGCFNWFQPADVRRGLGEVASIRNMIARCLRDQDIDHEHGETEEKHVVRGRIAAPPDVAPSELLRQIDAAMAKRSPCRIYSPDLCAAAGLTERVAFERRRFDILQQS